MKAWHARLLLAALLVGAFTIGLFLTSPETIFPEPRCETTAQARERLNVDADFIGPVPVECK